MRVTVGKERYEEVGLGLLALRELFSLNNRNSRSHESLRLKNTYKLEPIESAEREREREPTSKRKVNQSIVGISQLIASSWYVHFLFCFYVILLGFPSQLQLQFAHYY